MLHWPQKALLYLSFFNWLLIYEKTSRSTKKREKIQDKIKNAAFNSILFI